MSIQQLSALYEDVVEQVSKSLREADTLSIRNELEQHYPSELALILEALPHDDRTEVWALLNPEIQGQVLRHLHDIARTALIDDLGEASLVESGGLMDVDELANVVQSLPEAVSKAVIDSLDEEERRRFDSHFVYGENTAGRLMDTHLRTVRADVSLGTALRYLRLYGMPSHTDGILVVDRTNRYLGKLLFAALVAGSPQQQVAEVMDRDAAPIRADTPAREIAMLFEQRDLLSMDWFGHWSWRLSPLCGSIVTVLAP